MNTLLTRFTFSELQEQLKLKDNRSIVKWLNAKNIPYKRIGKTNYVLGWHLVFANALEIAEDLKKKFPAKWQKVFEATVTDQEIIAAVYVVLPPKTALKQSVVQGKTFFK